MPPKKKYYWDSVVFIAFLTGDKSPDEMAGIREIIHEVESNRAILVTTVLIKTEVVIDTLGNDI